VAGLVLLFKLLYTLPEVIDNMRDSIPRRREVTLYMEQAHQMLVVAARNLDDAFYASAVNRAYYAIFYAANALLSTQGLARSKHSGVISAFREHFVKPDLIEVEYSDIYGRVIDHRHVADYELELSIGDQQAHTDLEDAERFVRRSEKWLQQEGWL
jgi:uncharacterized protein (UPF0332 family)